MQRGGLLASVASVASNSLVGRAGALVNRQLSSLSAGSNKLLASTQAVNRQLSSLSSNRLLASTNAKKTKKKDGTQVALVALAALRQKKKADIRWRTNADRCRRLTLAWAFVLGVSAVFVFYALVASLKFGKQETSGLFSSWGVAFFYTAVLLEPTVICLLSALPCLATENTRLGRCCLRIKCVSWRIELKRPFCACYERH